MNASLCLTLTLLAWDRQKAFDYLESRGQQWAEWKPAQKPHGACVSCHTGLSYLIARRVLAEAKPRRIEEALVTGVRKRVLADPPQIMLQNEGGEAILNLVTLSLQRRDRDAPTPDADKLAIQRLWEKQITQGDAKGSWSWFEHALHPVESEHSHFYAATLVDYGLSAYPESQAPGAALLRGYIEREFPKQPLHNKLAWAAFSARKDQAGKAAVLDALWMAQSEDGGWTSAALGPWSAHSNAPPDTGSNAYATAWAAFTARQAGVSCSEPGLRRAFAWLANRQDSATGAWHAPSMNKVYPAGSMQLGFMTDAATGYATAALASCGL